MSFEEAQENIGRLVRSTIEFTVSNRLTIPPWSQWKLQSVDESTVTVSYASKGGEEAEYQGLSLGHFITEKAYKSMGRY